MRPSIHALLIRSLPRVFAAKAEILDRFWQHVFAQRPEYRPANKAQMLAQRDALEDILGKVIRALNSPEEFATAITDLRANPTLAPLKAQDSIVVEYAIARALQDAPHAQIEADEMAAWREFLSQFRMALDNETGLRHPNDRHTYFRSRKSSIP